MKLGTLALTIFVSSATHGGTISASASAANPYTVDQDFIQATLNRSVPIGGPQCLHGALRAGGYIRGLFMLVDHLNHAVIESCFRDLKAEESPQRGDIGQIYGEGEWPLHQFLFLNQRTAFQKINAAMEAGYEYTTLDRELLYYRALHPIISLKIRRLDNEKASTCAFKDYEMEFTKIYAEEPKFRTIFDDLETRIHTGSWENQPQLTFQDLLGLEEWARKKEKQAGFSLGRQLFYNSMANMVAAYLSLPAFGDEHRDFQDLRALKIPPQEMKIVREEIVSVGDKLIQKIIVFLDSRDRTYLLRHPGLLLTRFGKQYKWNREKKGVLDLELAVQCARSGPHFRIAEDCSQWKERLEKGIRLAFPKLLEKIRGGAPSFLFSTEFEGVRKDIQLQVDVESVFAR